MNRNRLIPHLLKKITHLLAEERAWQSHRLLFPVWLAIGVAIYFALRWDVPLWQCGVGLAASIGLAMCVRHTWGYYAALALCWVCLGMSVAALRVQVVSSTAHIHSVIKEARVEGFITQVDWYPQAVRVQLHVVKAENINDSKAIPLQSIVLNAYDALPQQRGLRAGQWLVARVSLRPAPAPVLPQHPDPRFRDYFEQVGARGSIRVVETLTQPTPQQFAQVRAARWWIQVQGFRVQLRDAIVAAIPGENGAIAAALVMGDRSGVTPETTQVLTSAGLLHFLSISGAHMAMVAGVVFLIFRRGLACVPGLALRVNLKKLAAFISFGVASFYLLLSGADFATQRAYVMIAVALLAVLANRPAFTLYGLCVAGIVIMLLNPESMYYPGLQMSFAATAALLGVVQAWGQWRAHAPEYEHSMMKGIALKFIHFAALSAAAGFATEPFAAFHFHQLMPYAMVGNIIAAPLIELIIMPFLVLGLVLLPLGIGGWPLVLVDWGLMQLKALSAFISSLPHAVMQVNAFSQTILLCAIAALVLLVCLRTRLRLLGLVPAGIGLFMFMHTHPPEVLGLQNLVSIGVQDLYGKIGIVQSKPSDFAIKAWQRAFGADVVSAAPVTGLDCAGAQCHLGTQLLISHTAPTVADCSKFSIVISAAMIPPECHAPIKIGGDITAAGPFLLWRHAGGGFTLHHMAQGRNRVWMRGD